MNLNRNVVLLHCDTSINGKCYYRCKGTIYFIDSTGKISSNKFSFNRNLIENENRLLRNNNNKRSHDFTLKTTKCLSSGKWSTDFTCNIEEELDSLNKLNVSANEQSVTYVRRRRRRRRRRPIRRFTPIRVGRPVRLPNIRPNRRRRQRRRKPSRRAELS